VEHFGTALRRTGDDLRRVDLDEAHSAASEQKRFAKRRRVRLRVKRHHRVDLYLSILLPLQPHYCTVAGVKTSAKVFSKRTKVLQAVAELKGVLYQR